MFEVLPQPTIYKIRFYRSSPGDAGFRDQPMFEFVPAEVPKALLARFNDPFRNELPPTQADIIDSNGVVLAKFRVVSPERVDTIAIALE